MKSLRWFISYLVVASLGLGLAFLTSFKFMVPAHSQEAPANGDLPPEFMKEAEPTQSPSKVPPPPESTEEPPLGEAAAVAATPTTTPDPSIENSSSMAEMPFDPASRRDPFKPFRVARPAIDPVQKQNLEPLQRFEVEKLQVIGILWDVKTPRAMIKDPEGGVHTVIKNSKVGRNEGFVATIREGEVVVVETLYDDGKVTKETRVMELIK